MGNSSTSEMAASPQGVPYDQLDHFINVDQQHLFRKVWKTEKEPRGLVCIVHGFAEHILSGYDLIAEPLAKEGCLVFGHDHLGHGQSEGERVDIEDFSIFVRDVLQHVNMMKKQYPDLPVFLVGHSMGGLISVMAAYLRVELFKGVVLIAPSFVVDKSVAGPCLKFVARCLRTITPQLVLSHLGVNGISRDPEVVKDYEDDPLVSHEGIKARFGVEMMNAMDLFLENVHKFEVPFLTMHGTADTVADPTSSQILYDKAKSRDKEIKIYKEFYHQLHKEPGDDGARARQDIFDWIMERISVHNSITI